MVTAGTMLQEFDWMRETRNSTEYPDFQRPTATAEDVTEGIPAATRIVELAERCGYPRGVTATGSVWERSRPAWFDLLAERLRP